MRGNGAGRLARPELGGVERQRPELRRGRICCDSADDLACPSHPDRPGAVPFRSSPTERPAWRANEKFLAAPFPFASPFTALGEMGRGGIEGCPFLLFYLRLGRK